MRTCRVPGGGVPCWRDVGDSVVRVADIWRFDGTRRLPRALTKPLDLLRLLELSCWLSVVSSYVSSPWVWRSPLHWIVSCDEDDVVRRADDEGITRDALCGRMCLIGERLLCTLVVLRELEVRVERR